jgi:hypothetical protein
MQNQYRFRQTKSTSNICGNIGDYHFYFLLVFLCAIMDTENRVLQHIQKNQLPTPPPWKLPEEHHLPIGSIVLNQSVSFNHPETQKTKMYKFSLLSSCTISIICVFNNMLKVSEVYLSIGSTLSTMGLRSLMQKCFRHSS